MSLPKHRQSNPQKGLTARPAAKKEKTQEICFRYCQHAGSEKERAGRWSAAGAVDSARADGMEAF
jgi:hypothetical protein